MEFEKIHNAIAGERIGALLGGIGIGILLSEYIPFYIGIILLLIGVALIWYYHTKFLKIFKREIPTLPGQIPPKKR